MLRLLIALIPLALSSCGGGGGDPQPANILGTWSGFWSDSLGILAPARLHVVTQTGAMASGSIELLDNNFTALIAGAIDGTVGSDSAAFVMMLGGETTLIDLDLVAPDHMTGAYAGIGFSEPLNLNLMRSP